MLEISTFQVDCTPPAGCAIGFGTDNSAAKIRDPLFLRGILLDDGGSRCLLTALDFLGLMNGAHDELVDALAGAAKVAADHTVLHCVHQHDTPLVNFEIESYIEGETFPRDWWGRLVDDCAAAATKALERMQPVAEVGHAEVRLHGFASNRRILGADGKVRDMRFSRCEDESLKAEPVGTIDPMLRSVAFRDDRNAILASLSFYATHPQVSNGRELYSADAEGEALRRLKASSPESTPMYFSGAFGNVTAGKYSSHTDLEGNLLHFGRLLADGIGHNLAAMSWAPPQAIDWKTDGFEFPRRDLDRAAELATIADSQASEQQRTVAAAILSCSDYEANATYPLRLLRLGDVQVLFLGGEPFVEYQLFAQSLVADRFLAVVANCSDSFLYLPTAEAFPQEGYEVTSFCWCTPAFEERFRAAVGRLLLAG
jgi:hypothetical protein